MATTLRMPPPQGGSGLPPLARPAPPVDVQPRCWRCDRVLLEHAARPWRVKCSRCKASNASEGG